MRVVDAMQQVRTTFVVTVLAVAALAFAPSVVDAQCNVEHPLKAGIFKASLCQAFVPCGGVCINAARFCIVGGGPCNTSADCPADICNANSCQASHFPCSTAADCQTCFPFCTLATCDNCSSDSDCGPGGQCRSLSPYGAQPQSMNSTTEGGIPSCKPPQTFNQQQGGAPSGWRWDPLVAKGTVSIKPKDEPACTGKDSSIGRACPGGLNPIGDTTDAVVQLKLKGIIATDAPLGATGNGTLQVVARMTYDDRMNGDMTVIDFPAGFPFILTGGKTSLKTSLDAVLNGLSQPGLPHCTSLEIVSIQVQDENGNPFGVPCLFLP